MHYTTKIEVGQIYKTDSNDVIQVVVSDPNKKTAKLDGYNIYVRLIEGKCALLEGETEDYYSFKEKDFDSFTLLKGYNSPLWKAINK